MALAAAQLADLAPKEAHKRALARYTFVFADAGLDWLRIWRNEFARSDDREDQRHSRNCKPLLTTLEKALNQGDGVHDYLGAKRQAAASLRGDDIDATVRLWEAVEPGRVRAICAAMREAHDALARVEPNDSVAIWTYLPDQLAEEITRALPAPDLNYWHLAVDSAASLRPYTLPSEGGGLIGRRITQINDVAFHLDALLPIAPVAEGHLVYDWLVRSAIGLELNALLDLSLGAPPGAKLNVVYPLVALCRSQGIPEDGESLERLRVSIGDAGWRYVRQLRNTVGAHLDVEMSMFGIHRHLVELDYDGVVGLAVHVLDFLDAIGAGSPGLKMLVLGERRIGSWPVDPEAHAPGRPHGPFAGSVAGMFRRFDSPYMAVSASSLGSAAVAGILAGRRPQPRGKAGVAGRAPRPWLNAVPSRLKLEAALGKP
jgi:hypothetical protein